MTTVTQTSREAYRQIRPKLGRQQQQVYDALKKEGQSCIADLSKKYGFEKSTVPARLNELKDKKRAEKIKNRDGEIEKRPSDATGVNSEFWRITPSDGMLF